MTTQTTSRKLKAILSADVKEYSRLMSQDEVGTIRTLNAYKEAMSALIEQYKGRVVDAPGDNLLAEFGSVSDAVNCSAEIQRELAEQNAELPDSRKMEFRIGINLGDVVEEEGRIYGDGVNIAARVESLAEGGGICISGTVYDQIKNKLGLEYECLGEQPVKNIPEPVRVYRVLSIPGAAAHRVVKAKEAVGRKWRKISLAIAAVVIVAAAAVAVWNFYLRPSPPVEVASVEKMAYQLPDKPSIAVMPFVNFSGDPEQEYLSDGISENIISTLSKLPTLFVIARGSTFAYKDKAVKIKHVSQELGVRYVVEGSVQRSGNHIRITAQLIDAIKGHNLWSERYDRNLRDIFALQDDITLSILKSLQLKIPEVFQQGLGAGTDNLEAYLKFLQGLENHLRGAAEGSKSGYELARRLYEEAISLDPKYANAYSGLGFIYIDEATLGFSESPEESFKKANKLAEKTLLLDSSFSGGHSLLAFIYLYSRQHDEAIASSKRALELNPNSAFDIAIAGFVLTYSGKLEEAIFLYEKSMRLDPYAPEWVYHHFGNAYHLSGQFQESILLFKDAVKRWPNGIYGHSGLAMSYSALGRSKEALEELEKYSKTHPEAINLDFIDWYISWLPFKNQSDAGRLRDLILKAGLGGDMPPAKSD
jgi:TolB-like protein/class 3 adenylate cyclase/Tfp pilus assembly protein PilF